MKIINLTQHPATSEQLADGVVDLTGECEDDERVEGYTHAMIGGAPFLMSALEVCLREDFLRPVYAFSARESVEVVKEDGCVEKSSVFKHAGWVLV